jgi:hypothetical protein
VWLTPTPAGREVTVPWTHPTGQWMVTTHWALIRGRAVIVGLDIRSFREMGVSDDPAEDRVPVGDDLTEVTQRVLRELPISKIRDAARADMLRDAEVLSRVLPDDTVYVERSEVLTAKGEPRKRRPKASEALLRHVAALYAEAAARGDKHPSKYVERELRKAGEPRLSTNGGRVLVRQWIRRARERGFLTIPPAR